MAKTKLMMVIHNAETDEYTEREYTAEEYAAHEAAKAEAVEYEAKRLADAEAKAALLARLGLTEDELKTILG
jgi:hypothetical protein